MFTVVDAAEIAIEPFLAREQNAEVARLAAAADDAKHASGVAWSGMAAPQPFAGRSEAEVRKSAEAAAARAAAFKTSPRGRFLSAVRELEVVYAAEMERVRAAYNRGFADARLQPNAAEVARALAVLNEINAPDARAAIGALAEILGADQRLAA